MAKSDCSAKADETGRAVAHHERRPTAGRDSRALATKTNRGSHSQNGAPIMSRISSIIFDKDERPLRATIRTRLGPVKVV